MPIRQTLTLAVEGMSCRHCAALIEERLSSLPGVEGVAVDLAGGTVEVSGHLADSADLVRELDAVGYPASVRA